MLATLFKKCYIKMAKGIHIKAQVIGKPASEALDACGGQSGTFDNQVAQSLFGRGNKIGVGTLGLLSYAKREIVLWAREIGEASDGCVETAAVLDGHRLGFIYPFGD